MYFDYYLLAVTVQFLAFTTKYHTHEKEDAIFPSRSVVSMSEEHQRQKKSTNKVCNRRKSRKEETGFGVPRNCEILDFRLMYYYMHVPVHCTVEKNRVHVLL